MAVIACPYCRGMMSNDSPACPHCRQPNVYYGQTMTNPRKAGWGPGKVVAVVFGCLTILGLLAVLALVLIGKSVPDTPHPNADAPPTEPAPIVNSAATIRSVLQQDGALGNDLNADLKKIDVHTDDDLSSMAQRIRQYVSAAESIEKTDTPPDFAEAYERHLGTWRELADTVDAHPHIQSDDEKIGSFVLDALDGSPTGGVAERSRVEQQWGEDLRASQRNVHRSWTDVLALSARYGAQ